MGDYVLISRWRDRDMRDPWFIGYICDFGKDDRGMYYQCEDNEGNKSRTFRNCARLTLEEGQQWFAAYKELYE